MINIHNPIKYAVDCFKVIRHKVSHTVQQPEISTISPSDISTKTSNLITTITTSPKFSLQHVITESDENVREIVINILGLTTDHIQWQYTNSNTTNIKNNGDLNVHGTCLLRVQPSYELDTIYGINEDTTHNIVTSSYD